MHAANLEYIQRIQRPSKSGRNSMARFNIADHILVPRHSKLSKEEVVALLESYYITLKDLPRINIKDAAISHLNVKEHDVIKIERKSPTAGVSYFYRRVARD